MSIYQLESVSTKLQVVHGTPLTATRGKTYEAEKENYLFGYSLKPSWLFVTGCPQHYDFVTSRHLQT